MTGSRVSFTLDITLGNVLSALAILVTLWTMHASNKERLARIETKLEPMWQVFITRAQRQAPRRVDIDG